MKHFFTLLFLCCLTTLLFTGGVNAVYQETPYVLTLPTGFPAPIIPDDNQLTKERVELGKMLFYDKILSSDNSISCASCHQPENSFSDRIPFSAGVRDSVTTRNTMPLVNLAWSNNFMWDGGTPTLELQVLVPLTSHKEMNLSIVDAVNRLSKKKQYVKAFKLAYNTKPDAGSLIKAIASFERTLISGNTKYDRFFYQKDATGWTSSEIRGLYIFVGGRAHCASCHSGVNLSSNQFQNNGLYEKYNDEGRFMVTGKESDRGKFKVPTLRNIALTAPYMHDGSMTSLEQVVSHYVSGGKNHPNKSPHVHFPEEPPLTKNEMEDLVNFLHTLTDEEFIHNPAYRINHASAR